MFGQFCCGSPDRFGFCRAFNVFIIYTAIRQAATTTVRTYIAAAVDATADATKIAPANKKGKRHQLRDAVMEAQSLD